MMKQRRRKWYQEDGEEGLNQSHCMDTKKDYNGGERRTESCLCNQQRSPPICKVPSYWKPFPLMEFLFLGVSHLQHQ